MIVCLVVEQKDILSVTETSSYGADKPIGFTRRRVKKREKSRRAWSRNIIIDPRWLLLLLLLSLISNNNNYHLDHGMNRLSGLLVRLFTCSFPRPSVRPSVHEKKPCTETATLCHMAQHSEWGPSDVASETRVQLSLVRSTLVRWHLFQNGHFAANKTRGKLEHNACICNRPVVHQHRRREA